MENISCKKSREEGGHPGLGSRVDSWRKAGRGPEVHSFTTNLYGRPRKKVGQSVDR